MNIKEDVKQMKTDIANMQISINYVVKMLEDISLTMSASKDNKDTLKSMMNGFKDVISKDPNLAKRPDVLNIINNLFKVTP